MTTLLRLMSRTLRLAGVACAMLAVLVASLHVHAHPADTASAGIAVADGCTHAVPDPGLGDGDDADAELACDCHVAPFLAVEPGVLVVPTQPPRSLALIHPGSAPDSLSYSPDPPPNRLV